MYCEETWTLPKCCYFLTNNLVWSNKAPGLFFWNQTLGGLKRTQDLSVNLPFNDWLRLKLQSVQHLHTQWKICSFEEKLFFNSYSIHWVFRMMDQRKLNFKVPNLQFVIEKWILNFNLKINLFTYIFVN